MRLSTDTCLSATDQDASHAAGANLVNFLRGDRTNEGAEKDNTKYYRQRLHVLGDMVNAQVVYVNKPLFSYTDRGYAGSYPPASLPHRRHVRLSYMPEPTMACCRLPCQGQCHDQRWSMFCCRHGGGGCRSVQCR